MNHNGRSENLRIGEQTFVGRAEIHLHASVIIGKKVCINDGVRIFTASHDVRHPEWPQITKPVVIGDYAWIASGAMILPGVTIGEGAVVGAGSVVVRDVPARAVAVGNPAKIIENVRDIELRYSPESFLAIRRAWLGSDPFPEHVDFHRLQI